MEPTGSVVGRLAPSPEAERDLVVQVHQEHDQAPGEQDLGRVLTLPNAITLVRLLCVPLFLWLLFGVGHQLAATILLSVLGATDWVDGYLARRLGQVTTLGKVLDPVADRILIGSAVIAAMVNGAVPLWFGLVTISREALVSGFTILLASLGARRIDVLWVGKAGTFALMMAYPGFLFGHGPAEWQTGIRDAAWVVGSIGLALAWIALASYIRPSLEALKEGRSA